MDTALGAVAQFETFDEKLTQADTFIRGALGLMSHQSARCVFDILLDYSRLSDACDTVNHQADKLKKALSTYGAAMNNVRNKYKDLIAFAQTAGLSVVGDYTNCTVTLDASGSSQQDFMYGLAQSALKNAKSLQIMAEHEFATALNDVDTTLWEKTLTSLIDQLKDTHIPNPERPLSSLPATMPLPRALRSYRSGNSSLRKATCPIGRDTRGTARARLRRYPVPSKDSKRSAR